MLADITRINPLQKIKIQIFNKDIIWIYTHKLSSFIKKINKQLHVGFLEIKPEIISFIKFYLYILKQKSINTGYALFENAGKIAIAASVFLTVLTFLAISLKAYYRDKFYPNTYINGIYCAGYDIFDASDILKHNYNDYTVTIKFDDKEYLIDVGYYIEDHDYSIEVEDILTDQKEKPLFKDSFIKKEYTFKPDIVVNDSFKVLWSEMVNDYTKAFYSYHLENGIYVEDNRIDRILNEEKAYNKLIAAIKEHKSKIDFTDDSYYYSEDHTKYSELINEFNKIAIFQQSGPTFDIETEIIKISPLQMCSLIKKVNGRPVFNEYGDIIIDEDAFNAILDDVLSIYNTYEEEYIFKTVNGDVRYIPSVNYGSLIDTKSLENWLNKTLLKIASGKAFNYIYSPEYIKTAYVKGSDNIGKNYIEISLEEQKLYIISESQMVFETDILSGGTDNPTHPGVYTVLDKQRERLIYDLNYMVLTDKWIHLCDNFDIISASWRDEFGQEAYKKSGTAGSIEVSDDDAEYIYNFVQQGMPVVIY